MVEWADTHHFDGDGCAVYGPYKLVEFVRRTGERGMCEVEELEPGDVWRDPETDSSTTWWHALEVQTLTAWIGDEPDPLVHVEYEQANDPHA